MKRMIMFLTLVLVGLVQVVEAKEKGRLQTNIPYGRYTIAQVWDSLSANNVKANKACNFILKKTGESKLSEVMSKSKVIEKTLYKGKHLNSGWDPEAGDFKFFPGQEWYGRIMAYINDGDTIDLFKFGSIKNGKAQDDICANLLDEVVQKTILRDEDAQDPNAQPEQVYYLDTVHKQVYVYETYTEKTVYVGDGINYSQAWNPCYYPTQSWCMSVGYTWCPYASMDYFQRDYAPSVTNNYYYNYENYYNSFNNNNNYNYTEKKNSRISGGSPGWNPGNGGGSPAPNPGNGGDGNSGWNPGNGGGNRAAVNQSQRNTGNWNPVQNQRQAPQVNRNSGSWNPQQRINNSNQNYQQRVNYQPVRNAGYSPTPRASMQNRGGYRSAPMRSSGMNGGGMRSSSGGGHR